MGNQYDCLLEGKQVFDAEIQQELQISYLKHFKTILFRN